MADIQGSVGKLLSIIANGVTGGGGGTGPAVTIANGADVVEGSTTDAGVSTDANGTINAHIRGLIILIVNLLSRWPASLGAKTAANSLAVTLPTDQAALSVNNIGATNIASTQATAGAAATLVAARATRKQVTIKNIDTSLTVFIGPATVTAANGMQLLAGESITVTWTGLIQVFAASGSPVVCVWDEYY